ncbi:Gldg family protein [Chitinophaga sp. XS-30]|uniref:Gldg family protein n=1 Tax=Chitinophaga sp. XS-30 TaxID=2604421 RepID=UPI0011DE079F|nr:Gldg family protein [Chitinophaga sp. XS-30]QEH40741.1 ABC transporter permease subunit [Chitinophaga sp. XS-30]
MKQIIRIARTELQLLFYSPIAWLILIVFTIQASLVFTGVLGGAVNFKELGYKLEGVTLNLYTDPRMGFYARLLGYLYFYIPLLTMGMMSRELSSGSIKLLYSSPISDAQIIFGKFLSIASYALLMTGIVFLFTLYGAFVVDQFDFPATLTGLLGIFLLICAYGAVGLFMSSLTSYQVVSAMGTFAVFAVLNYTSQLWQDVPFVRDIMFWLSISGRTNEFIGGIISSEDVIYFIAVIGLFLGLCIFRFRAIRQKTRPSVSMGRYLLVIGSAVVVGYLSSRPAVMYFYDATRTKLRTLTKASQDIVSKAEGGLTITTYANALDEDRWLWMGMPRAELDDMRRLREYVRFKPEIKMKYVHYFAKGRNEKSLDQRYPMLDDRARMGKVAQAYGVDSALFLPVDEIGNIKETLAGEEFRHVKVLKRENGQQSVLRVFNDAMGFPSEREISAAIKRLVTTLPKVAFVEGHGERDCIKEGDRDYNKFARENTFRYSLINQGFDFEQLSLDREVPSHVSIMVIADMKTAMPESHLEHLKQYIARGGNLLIAAEPKRQDAMNGITALFGVQMMEGRLVKPSRDYQADLIFTNATKEAGELADAFSTIHRNKGVVVMPSVVGLRYNEAAANGYTAKPLFVTDSAGVWNELKTVDFVDDSAAFNPAAGETAAENLATAVALSRKVGEKEQKIIILGDADCMSNGELGHSRKDIMSSNFMLIAGSFNWLSDYEAPVDVNRPPFTDNDIKIGKTGFRISKIAFTGVLPAAMVLCYLIIWFRRRRQ